MKKFLCLLLSLTLLSGLFIIASFAEEVQISATRATAAICVNGKYFDFEAYNIGGYNYLKLRDIAFAINGTDRNFEVVWDEDANSIRLISNTAYTPVGGEMEKKTPSLFLFRKQAPRFITRASPLICPPITSTATTTSSSGIF